MKWFAFLCLLLGLVLAVMADEEESRGGPADYTSRYAELASPVPAHVNVPELLASLASYHR